MERYSGEKAGKYQSHSSEEFKRFVVYEYLRGNIFMKELGEKYKLRNARVGAFGKVSILPVRRYSFFLQEGKDSSYKKVLTLPVRR
jgi:hypothetical protein